MDFVPLSFCCNLLLYQLSSTLIYSKIRSYHDRYECNVTLLNRILAAMRHAKVAERGPEARKAQPPPASSHQIRYCIFPRPPTMLCPQTSFSPLTTIERRWSSQAWCHHDIPNEDSWNILAAYVLWKDTTTSSTRTRLALDHGFVLLRSDFGFRAGRWSGGRAG